MNIDENKFLELIEQLPNMAVQGYDRERKVIYWNSASEVVYGYTKEEALGKKLEDLIIPDFMRNAVIEGVENWYEKGEAIPSSELQLQHKDGSGVYVYSSHIILYEDTDKPEMFCLDVDLSQQKNQEKELVSLNERMELALLGNSDALWDWNILTNDIYYSPRWKEMLGYSDDELPNEFTVWQGKMHQDDVENTLQDVQKHLSGESDFMDSTLRLRCKDESWIWVRCRAKAIFDEDGQAVRMIGTNTDITKDKEFELKYQEQTQMLKDSQRITKIGSWKLDLVENSLSWSDEIYRMFEIDSQTLPSYELFLDSIHPQDRVSVNEAYSKSLEDKKPYEIMHRLLLKNAKVRYVREQCETEFDVEGNPLVSVGTVQDITEQRKIENKLEEQKDALKHQANHDTLTGLPNRVLFSDRLEQAIEKAKRNNSKVALLFIDLDHFKEINDSLGHIFGDEVLKIVTHRLQGSIRDEDTLARFGGDEFVVILEDLAHEEDASLIASKILLSTAQAIEIEGNVFYLSNSIGISVYPNDGENPQNLLKYADSAMYKAKSEGRNNYQYYDVKMTELAFERVVMERELRTAIQNREFVVYYQAQMNGKTDTLIGMEALVRWEHPTKGLISPAKFIPLAESTGLIVELDRYVMKVAMVQFAQWHEKGLKPGVLAMNLSIKQLKKEDFVEVLHSLLEESKCRAEWIELEVTESQIMTNPDEAIKVLQKISDLGVELAVDDFGTGYSSLAYLKRLPINKLKIDQAFIKDLPDDEEDSVITKAIIALANSLNLKVIAEGVETKEQRDFIVESGCENIQGYLYSKPLPADEVESTLRESL